MIKTLVENELKAPYTSQLSVSAFKTQITEAVAVGVFL